MYFVSGSKALENSVRDTFVPALRLLDYSINTTDEDELNEALSMLCDQKDLVYSYLVDSSADENIQIGATLKTMRKNRGWTIHDVVVQLNDQIGRAHV